MRSEDLSQVNAIFTKAFTEARVDEGLKLCRVSPCRPEFLRMYLERSAEGALVAVDHERVAGFNFNHLYGSTGWMGPLAVMPRYQGTGVGKALVSRGLDYLRGRGARILGLETMPRNYRNIGFYARLGFEVGPLCVDMAYRTHGEHPRERNGPGEVIYFSESPEPQRKELLAGAGRISEAIATGLDYRGEIKLNMNHRYGDTAFLVDGSEVTAFAVCHAEPYGQFEERRELKVYVLAVCPDGSGVKSRADDIVPSDRAMARLSALLTGVRALALRENLSAVRLHPRTDKTHALRMLLSLGYAVAYSDLRLWLSGYRETEPASYVHFCRWQ